MNMKEILLVMKNKFKIDDKLKSTQIDFELHGLSYVTITSINEENKVYHWEAKIPNMQGILHSGYYFKEAKLYEE